jgi:peptide/nickel transport system substrate-binding protein
MPDRDSVRSSWSRRAFIRNSTALAAGAYAMRWGFGHAQEIPLEFDGSKFQLAAPEPNPKRGGTLRIGITMRPPHFDVHQSGTINNLGSQGVMFDNLIRHDPRDGGKTIIPDLAHSWEISKDAKTYTFHLRDGVQFHDGAELTSEDVKATFDRIRKPPQGVSIPRSVLFKAVGEINAPDKRTVQFVLSEPRPPSFIMAAIASGWNVILRKKTLEDNNYNLRRVEIYPGTGPFKSVKRVENESWLLEKNANYWNKGLPYVDAVQFFHALPFSTELGSAVLSNRVDYVRITDPVTARTAAQTKGMKTTAYNQSVIQGCWVNSKKKPFDDPRIRRAMHLAFDRPVLVEVVKDVAPMQVGGFVYPFSEFATPKEELTKRLGYQDDTTAALKEAKALLAAAGQANGIKGLDFLVRDVPTFKLWAQAIQAMLQQIGIEANLRTTVESVWFDDTANGNYDLAVGAIVSTLLDPSDYFNAWYRTGGPQNYGFWDNKEFNALVDQIDREVDHKKRVALVRQAEEIMEKDPPVLPVSWEQINDVWYDYVKGLNPYDFFGVYDVVRQDTVWLDKA